MPNYVALSFDRYFKGDITFPTLNPIPKLKF